ncbi:MAG: sodium:alanine symporter family protein [Oscillospiraceae bacterium]|nr:sodium:alanine symporter family protein [Oscillospiraceae bacterium]
MKEWMTQSLESLNGFLWGPGMLVFYIGVGLLLTLRTRFFQVRHFGAAVKSVFEGMLSERPADRSGGVSAFQAVATALAGTMGVGNIAGAAAAIAMGGAGAIFWMWVSAFLGMMTKFAEAVLAVRFRDERGSQKRGGPMYYISRGLRTEWLAVMYAVFCLLACFGVGCMTPAGEVAGAMGELGVPIPIVSGVISCVCAVVIFGGIKRIGKLSERIIPILSLLYILFSLVAILIKATAVPNAVGSIFRDAFDFGSVGGGVLGFGISRAMRFGLARGVYTNEAGMGSSAIAHAASGETEPVKQGMLGIFEVFLDTFVVTTLTALVILTAFDGDHGSLALIESGATAAERAFSASFGSFGKIFVAVSMFCFALPSMFGWAYYGEESLRYIIKDERRQKGWCMVFRVLFSAAAAVGALADMSALWSIADVFNGLMAIPNLTALLFLSGVVVKEVKRYEKNDFRE